MAASVAFVLVCLACILLGAGVGKPLGWIAILFAVLGLLIQLGVVLH